MRTTLALTAIVLSGSLSLVGCGSTASTGAPESTASTSGAASDAGAVAAAADLPTEPPAGRDPWKVDWYEGSPPILRATSGAIFMAQTDYIVSYDDDGIKGMIKNYSDHDILVLAEVLKSGTQKAILKPGDELPYKVFGTGVLEFSKMIDGAVVPDTTTKLWMKDPAIGRPSTKFTPPGRSEPANVRTGWREQTSAEEIWGSIKIKLTREKDGWTIPASDAYLKLYRDPNTQGSSDWAVFTIEIYSL
jgi:hypothetical protein